MHFRHTFATFLPKNLYFKKFGGENSNLAEFYSRFGGQLSISSDTAARRREKGGYTGTGSRERERVREIERE